MERDTRPVWRRAVAGPALGSAFLLWLAFPPVGAWPLAWLAPAGWLWLVQRADWPTRRPYLVLYVSGAAFWLVELQGIRLANAPLYIGWLALALYLAVYTPLWVGVARILTHRLRLPLPLAGAIAWTGAEYARAYFATGFTGALLAHSQTPAPELIQLAAWGGPYVVSFAMVLAAGLLVATFGEFASPTRRPSRGAALAAAGLAIPLLVGFYGRNVVSQFELPAPTSNPARSSDNAAAPPVRVALIQDSVDTIFEFNPERNRETFAKYRRLTLEACRTGPRIDLVVWPESVFTENSPDLLGGPADHPELKKKRLEFADKVAWLARDVNRGELAPSDETGTWLLVGTVTLDLDHQPMRESNSALLINPRGEIVARYYKQHLVMFGEYIPFGDWFPWLYSVTPMPAGLWPGQQAESLDVRGLRFSPSICFESMVPQLLRRQVAELRARDQAPDVLVNITNDGWFWGSSILDMHQQAAVFRAVEHRLPLLVAANTGLSFWVDAAGVERERIERRQAGVIIAELPRSAAHRSANSPTPYQRYGDLPALACLIVGIGAIGSALISRGVPGRSLDRAEE